MSMIVHLIRTRASRRERHKEATRSLQKRPKHSRPARIRSRRYRRILAAILILIGTIAFG